MKITINPNAEFTTGQVGQMLGISADRVKALCQRNLVPATKADAPGGRSRWKIKYRDFETVIEANRQMRSQSKITESHLDRIKQLEDRVTWLERAFDEYTAPEVADPIEL